MEYRIVISLLNNTNVVLLFEATHEEFSHVYYSKQYLPFFSPEFTDDAYTIACLLMVFVAVSLPKLARTDASYFRTSIEGIFSFLFQLS